MKPLTSVAPYILNRFHLHAFFDSDWAGCLDMRRSSAGFATFIGSNCIPWTAKIQPTIAQSTTTVEYRSMASAAAELTWISYITSGAPWLNLPLSTAIMSALQVFVKLVFHSPMKHVALDYHFLREKVALGFLTIEFVPSAQQIADIFTKTLSKYL